MPQTVQQALNAASFYSDSQPYAFVRLPAAAIMAAAGVVAEISEPFCALLVDKDEVTLMIPAEAWDDFAKRLPGSTLSPQRYRLITIDVALDPDLIGFMAHVIRALADAGISILPLAAYTRDHLFVTEENFELAIATLEKLKSKS
jgi:uncharacterized protein